MSNEFSHSQSEKPDLAKSASPELLSDEEAEAVRGGGGVKRDERARKSSSTTGSPLGDGGAADPGE